MINHDVALPAASLRFGRKVNNSALLPHFCKVLLDARGTVGIALGDLGKYEQDWSGKSRLD